jgi:hypothetical protein
MLQKSAEKPGQMLRFDVFDKKTAVKLCNDKQTSVNLSHQTTKAAGQ